MNAKWRYRLKELFTFSKKERLGFIVLLFLVLIVLCYPLLDSSSKDNYYSSFEEFAGKVDSVEAQKVKLLTDSIVPLFSFDPNTADSLTFLRLGFSPRQVGSILSYRSTGAWFSHPDDFSKLYVVSKEQFEQLKPYISIKQPIKPIEKVDLNTADTVQMQRLRGIGSYYARQIVRYREHLGGFYKVEQLKEIKGIDEKRFSLFEKQLSLSRGMLHYLDVNSADESTLKSHPYIGSTAAKAIVAYREETPIRSVEQLVEFGIMTKEQLEHLRPYLKF